MRHSAIFSATFCLGLLIGCGGTDSSSKSSTGTPAPASTDPKTGDTAGTPDTTPTMAPKTASADLSLATRESRLSVCKAILEHVSEAHCANNGTTETECADQLEEVLPACATQSQAFVECVLKSKIECDANGGPVPVECKIEVDAISKCVMTAMSGGTPTMPEMPEMPSMPSMR